MSVQITIFLLLFGGLQGVLLTLFLVRRKFYCSGNIFLLLYFAVLLLQVVLKVMSKGWLWNNWRMFYNISYDFPILYGPLVYLFARQMTGSKWKAIHLLHFLPFLVLTMTYVRPLHFSLPTAIPSVNVTVQLVSISIYHWLAYATWKKYAVSIKKNFTNVENLQLNWLRRFIFASVILCSIIAITICMMYLWYPKLQMIRMGFLSLTAFIYWVSYQALTQPGTFSVVHVNITGLKEPTIVTELTPMLQISRPAPKYRNSSLPESEAARIIKLLDECMLHEKPQLDPELTIDKMAKRLLTNRHHLSQVLNDKIGLSFYDYINSYRVNEAKKYLGDPSRANYKIASIAYDAGFNSLSAFNDVFKKMTGQTPSQFRKHPPPQVVQSARG